MNTQILIIGGGFAGLAAAVRLSYLGYKLTLLEQKHWLGGRAYSFKDPKTGDIVDNGQHAFMGCYKDTLSFLATIGTLESLRFDPSLHIDFYHPGGRRSTLSCPSLPASLNLLWGLLGYDNLGFKDKVRLILSGPSIYRSLRGNSEVLDQYSVAQWLTKLKQTDRARKYFWDPLTIATLNDSPDCSSAYLLAQVLKLAFFSDQMGSRKALSSVPLSDLYTKAASHYISSRGGNLELGKSVKHLNFEGEKVVSAVLHDGAVIQFDTVILAVPPESVAKLLPEHILEDESFKPIMKMSYSPITSVHLWYDREVLKTSYIGLLDTGFQWAYDLKKISNRTSNIVSLVFSNSVSLQEKSNEQIIDCADKELKSVYPSSQDARLLHGMVIHERKATPCLPPGSRAWRPKQQTPIKNLLLAGDWTNTELPATIESAVKSGYICAELIQGLRP